MATLINVLLAATPAEAFWSDQFVGLDAEQRFTLLLVGLGCLTGVLITISVLVCNAYVAAQRRRIEAELKRDMLDRGMTAEEVVKVIEASAPVDVASGAVHAWCKRK
jgi:hypothetical protein